MNNESGVTGVILFVVVAFIVIVLGFNLFPGLNTEVSNTVAVATTNNWNAIETGVISLKPFAFLGAIFLGLVILWAKRG